MITLWRCFYYAEKQHKICLECKKSCFYGASAAMQLVLTRVLVLDLGPYRITVGTVCTVLAGLWMGPVAGGICGLCADIVGCFLKGYAVNPFITLASILWGVLPALFRKFYLSKSRKAKTVGISVSIVITGVISSLCLTTAGLVLMLGYNFYAIMPGRLVQFAIMTPIYCVLTCLLYFSPLTLWWQGTALPLYWKRELYKVRRRNFLTKNYIFDSPYRTWY